MKKIVGAPLAAQEREHEASRLKRKEGEGGEAEGGRAQDQNI